MTFFTLQPLTKYFIFFCFSKTTFGTIVNCQKQFLFCRKSLILMHAKIACSGQLRCSRKIMWTEKQILPKSNNCIEQLFWSSRDILISIRWQVGWQISQQPACLLRQLSGFKSRHLSKHKMGDISKGVANTLQPAKKIYKKTL